MSARLRHVWRPVTSWARAGAWVAALALAAPLALESAPAMAQGSPFGGGNTLQQRDPNQPMLLQADEMVYDNQNNRVTARGNVEIYYGTYTLIADKVTYDRAANTLIAEGNVSIKEPDGAVINADRITLTDDFRDGFIGALKIVTQDDARIVAARAIREQGETTVFEHAAFTPCKPCEDNPEAPPTWQVKATKVIHKKSEATISYQNAKFELWGVPVAWMPYFKHADPSVKRKSGFLIPRISGSDDLGTTVETPYYFALAPNYDLTVSPVYSERRGLLMKAKWRHRTANGRYDVDLAGIYESESNALQSGTNRFRGTIKTEGAFALNQYWEWGWDVTAETDDTFRRFYNIDGILTTDRVSEVFLRGQRGRNYFNASAYNFGGLLATDGPASESWVHPVIDYNYIFDTPVVGGELALDTNILSYTGENGEDTARFIAQMNWRRTFIDGRGQVITPFVQGRGDYYYVNNVIDPDTGLVGETNNIVRGAGTVGLEYRYPFVTRTARAAHVIEPIAQVYARTNGGDNKEDVPNEDAQSLVFDDTLLFDINKFSGYDRIDEGSRANVGVRYTMQSYSGGYIQAVAGQSFELGGSNPFDVDSGLETKNSDYVAGLYIEPMNYFSFIAQGRFDDDDLSLKRTDLTAQANYGPFASSVTYANLEAQPGLNIDEDREEIQGGGSVALAQNWTLLGNIRYDLERDARVSDSLGLKYHDDCFALTLSYDETFVRDRDIEPNQKVMLRFELKHLGAFDVDAL